MIFRSALAKKIDAVQRLFAFYGFIASPLSRRKIAHLICRGKTLEDIYEIGCDYEQLREEKHSRKKQNTLIHKSWNNSGIIRWNNSKVCYLL